MELIAAKKRARKQNDMADDSAEEVEEGDENASIESAEEDQLSSESDGDSLETRHNKQVARQKKEQREKQREEQQEKARVVTGRRRREIDDADVLEYEDEQGNRQRMTIAELEAEEKQKSKDFIAEEEEEVHTEPDRDGVCDYDEMWAVIGQTNYQYQWVYACWGPCLDVHYAQKG